MPRFSNKEPKSENTKKKFEEGRGFMPEHEDYAIGAIDGKSSASYVVDEMRRSFKPPGAGVPTTPAEKIDVSLSEVQNSIREQQMLIEQDLQSALSKASTHVTDSQSVDTLLAVSQQVASVVSQGNEAVRSNSQHLGELISLLGNQLSMQQAKADRQVAQALQKAVCSLADAQSAMFQSMAISEMAHYVKGADQVVKDIIAPGQVQ
ncbi:MAG TPA: hypothetical protein GX529_00030 [Firmicutes bacterium]|nr:hypothetical protein [Candidatus Fermentithermobacillaceae bacterium]